MTMSVRLSEAETMALARQAEMEGRSVEDVARAAVLDYLSANGREAALERVLTSELPRYADALDRLGRRT